MKRSSGLLIGFAAAAITVISLFAFAGPRNFGQYGHRNGNHGQCGRYEKEPGKKSNVPETRDDSKTNY